MLSFEHRLGGPLRQDGSLTGLTDVSKYSQSVRTPRSAWEECLQELLISATFLTDERDAQLCRILDRDLHKFTHMDGRLRQQRKFIPLLRAAAAYDEFLQLEEYRHFVISYPKSGRTWLHVMLGYYLAGGVLPNILSLGSPNMSQPVHLAFTHDNDPHLCFSTALRPKLSDLYQNKTVIFLARDPRDVVVSQFFQYTKRGGNLLAADASFCG